jgi:protein-tyrosine kinase
LGTNNVKPKDVRQVIVEINALRAGGYLPEVSKGRQFADHFRQIKRALIEKALRNKPGPSATDPRLIMVTSGLPGEGKTFTSINLALSFARERDLSILLVDADVAKPRVSETLGLREEPGLLHALLDETIEVESLVLPTNLGGFSILPAGKPVEGAEELLSSNRMRDVMRALISQNPRRIVLMDSPPLLITSEGRALIKAAGQFVLVVRAGQTPRHAIRDALSLFGDQQTVGLVLNDGRPGLTEGYYGYGQYGTYFEPGSEIR